MFTETCVEILQFDLRNCYHILSSELINSTFVIPIFIIGIYGRENFPNWIISVKGNSKICISEKYYFVPFPIYVKVNHLLSSTSLFLSYLRRLAMYQMWLLMLLVGRMDM
jgi:hypothetical protein